MTEATAGKIAGAGKASQRPFRRGLLLLLVAGCAVLAACIEVEDSAPPTAASLREQSERALTSGSWKETIDIDPLLDWAAYLRFESSLATEETRATTLYLEDLETLTEETARIIDDLRWHRLHLPALKSLDAAQAKALTRRVRERGSPITTGVPGPALHLNGLESLDHETARILVAAGPAMLSLDGLREIDADLATILATTCGSLSLDGLESLQPEVAAALAGYDAFGEQVFLSLRGLRRIEVVAMRELLRVGCWGLDLSGLPALEPEIALALKDLHLPCLKLNGLRSIEPETARIMAGWEQKFLILDGLRQLDPGLRQLIERGTEALSLRSLREEGIRSGSGRDG